MLIPCTETALAKAGLRVCLIVGTTLIAGCVGYTRKPLLAEEFQQVLARRTPAETSIVQGVSSAAYAPEDGLDLEEAELLALYMNPRLRSARLAAEIPVASSQYAGLWDDPEIGFDALRILEDVDERLIAGASLSFSIPISGRLNVARSLADKEARVALIEAWTEEQDVLLDLRKAWADWESAIRMVEASRRQYDSLQQLITLTNDREELGEIIMVEALAFRLEEARLRTDLESLEAKEMQSRMEVIGLLGFLPNADISLAPSSKDGNLSEEVALESIYERSPQVILAAARYVAAEERLRLEIRKQYPDITLGPLYGNEEGMHRLGVGFSIPIPILNANKQGIAEAEASREAHRADWEKAVQDAMMDLSKAEATLKAIQKRLTALQETVVPLANQQIQQARQLADLGEINTLLILEALQAEREAVLDLIEAQAAKAQAQAQVRFVIPGDAPSFDIEQEEEQ